MKVPKTELYNPEATYCLRGEIRVWFTVENGKITSLDFARETLESDPVLGMPFRVVGDGGTRRGPNRRGDRGRLGVRRQGRGCLPR